jgi:hypothetical protein
VNALKTIMLVDENYALENNLHEAQAQMAAIVSQNKLLQKQLSCSNPCATVDSKGCVTFLEVQRISPEFHILWSKKS